MFKNNYSNPLFHYYSKLRITNDEFPYFLIGFEGLIQIGSRYDLALNTNLDTKLKLNCRIEKQILKNSNFVLGFSFDKNGLSPHYNLEFNYI